MHPSSTVKVKAPGENHCCATKQQSKIGFGFVFKPGTRFVVFLLLRISRVFPPFLLFFFPVLLFFTRFFSGWWIYQDICGNTATAITTTTITIVIVVISISISIAFPHR